MSPFIFGDFMITLDGSIGEGGGQILRSAVALSMVTDKPFRIDNIRAKRDKPGLMRQHLTAITAAEQVCNARVIGAALGSRTLEFHPGKVTPGNYRFAVGTAGSATLVLQTILPALMIADAPSHIDLEGGTHNPWAPPFDFLEKCFLPLIARMGPRITAKLECPGFYPAGGGKFSVDVAPAKLSPLHLTELGQIRQRRGRALIAGLPRRIAERETSVLAQRTGWPADALTIQQFPDSCGPGNSIVVEIQSDHVTELFTAFGQKGITSEALVDQLVAEVRAYEAARVPVGQYLADQLLLPLALARGGSFLTLPLSRHAHTNIEVIGKFLNVAIVVEESRADAVHVRVG
jgi:RNA 3'-terminal phosphate cyclase (ATP)